jgi:hypothetical protein
MGVCYDCANIELRGGECKLATTSTTRSRAEEGCPGCKFFSDNLARSGSTFGGDGAVLHLHRVSDKDNRVILQLRTDYGVVNIAILRLCSSYGVRHLLCNKNSTDSHRV